MTIFDHIKRLVFRRRHAYRMLFQPGGQMSVAAGIVLSDLRRFTRANKAPAITSLVSGNVDPIATGIAIGRQEVWHRIASHLNMSDADLYRVLDPEAENDTI